MPLTLDWIMARNGKRDSARAVHCALGQRLAYFRKHRGYSQAELARRVGAVQVVISDYEVGKLRLTAEAALRIEAALDVPIQDLLNPSKPLPVEPPRPPNRRVLRRLERIERLPRRKQEALLTTIDVFLKTAG